MPGSDITTRSYEGASDLAPLLAFASRACATRFPLYALWHPGDLVWELKPDYGRPHRVRLWRRGSDVVAATMFPAADQLWCEILPEAEHLFAEIVSRAERSAMRTGQTHLSIKALDGDQVRDEALSRLGYRRSAEEGVCFRIDLAATLPASFTPDGYRVRDSAGIDPAPRARAHRDAWDDLSEIGLPDARSTFSADVYAGLSKAPVYDPSLDILVVAPDGTLVANCICWADAESGIATFEPVGTHAHYRRRGLARLAMHEALRRVQARGMKWARVSTAHFNAPAIAAYTRAGFELCDRGAWWTKDL
jgi:ribosomal protein S18 acetylase RimI-like enzyme